ncbi:MAG: IS66 family transposase [Candidatus Levybacteria bacterium]|nr:IS66 family transposase [Candidatus Levybacteria bacterium]
MSDLLTAPRGELIQLIYELTERIEILESELARVKAEKDHKDNNHPHIKAPSFVKANKKPKKKTRRKKRGTAYVRKKETPTEQIFHTAQNCSNCGTALLGKPTVAYTRQVIDIPVTPYTVTEHVVCRRWCLKCHKQIVPIVDLSDSVLGKKRIGVNLAASITTMRDRLRLPLGMIKVYVKMFHGLSLSEGEIVKILDTVAKKAKPQYDNLLKQIRGSHVVHADETGGRQNGVNGYFWSFSTENIHYLMYRKSRGKTVVEEIVGTDSEKFNGVLTTDFYAAYNTYTGFHQRCWVHFLRDIHELKENYKKHPPLNMWVKKVKQIYEEAKAYSGPDPNLPIGLQTEARLQKQKEFEQRLRILCIPYVKKDAPMSTLSARAITFLPELFVFIRFPNVKSDNNQAERIIRHTVVARKISGGTKTPKGSETKAILTSLFDTWQLQNLNPLQQCRLLLTS